MLEIRHDHHAHAGRLGRAGAVLAVLERDAILGRHAQARGREQVQRRVGLAVRHLVAAGDALEILQHVDVAEAMADLLDVRRRRDGARNARRVQRLEQRQRTGLERKHRRAARVRQQRVRLGGRGPHGLLAAQQVDQDRIGLLRGAADNAHEVGHLELESEGFGAFDPGHRDGSFRVDQQAVHVEDGGLEVARPDHEYPPTEGRTRAAAALGRSGARPPAPWGRAAVHRRLGLTFTACASRAKP